MFTWRFWRAVLERAIRTMAQTIAAMLSTGALGILEVQWMQVGSVAIVAGISSVFTSIASGSSSGNLSFNSIEQIPAQMQFGKAIPGLKRPRGRHRR